MTICVAKPLKTVIQQIFRIDKKSVIEELPHGDYHLSEDDFDYDMNKNYYLEANKNIGKFLNKNDIKTSLNVEQNAIVRNIKQMLYDDKK